MAKNQPSFESLLGELRESGVRIGSLAETLQPTESWSTGNLALDSITGIGGIPVGRIVEFYGLSQSGKTSSAVQTAVALQQKIKAGEEEGVILFLDFEQALDLTYCQNLGLDTEHPSFLYMSPVTLEEGANAYRKLLNAGYVRLCIVDSVAAMVSEKEAQAETGTVTVADRAKALYQFCRQILGPLQQNRSSIIFLNHLLDVIPTTPFAARVKQTTTPGGRAIPFYSSLRVEFKAVGKVKTKVYDSVTDTKEEMPTATAIQAIVVKNKTARPQRFANLRIRYGVGFSQSYSVFQVLYAHKVITKRGAWYDVPERLAMGTKTAFQGEEAILAILETDERALERWVTEAQRCVAGYDDTQETLDSLDLADNEYLDKETGEVKVKV